MFDIVAKGHNISRLPHLPIDKSNKLLVIFGAKVRRTIDPLEKRSKFGNVL
jgi:hypothetical protein